MRELDVRQEVSASVPYNTRCQSSRGVREEEKGPRRAVSIETRDRYGVEASESDTKVCMKDPLTIKRYCRHAEGMAKIYRDHVFHLHGLPRKIIHDRGTQFDAKMMKELYKLLHIEGNPSTAYHPQTDGQTEHVNQELEQYLRLYVNHRQSDWADWLALAEFAHNNRVHSATKMSPFYANTGRHPMDLSHIHSSSPNLSAEDFAKHMKETHALAQANLVKAADDMKRFHDRHAGEEVEYETGAKVFLDGRNIKTT